MLISRTWLETLLVDPATGTAALPDDAALDDAITSVGLEVEGVHRYGDGLESIVVGEVRAVEPHPQADKLRLVQLFDGSQTLSVVCGAPNVPPPGGKVAFAPVGTTLPGGLTLTARKVRGVESHGMICSEDELEIGPDHDGILVLPPKWPAGDRLIDRVPGIVDTVFELGITPNRPDALGHVGVARDLAVKLGRTLVVPPLQTPRVDSLPSLVTIEAPERCGRYFGYAFEGAKIGPSPLWMRVRLHRLGLRPINNVVDITNLVLMEWGQPLHAFDRANLAEGRVVVRTAREGERLKTLDAQTLELRTSDLVIADAEVPQALAGVMGGEHSGVDAETSTLLLEAAWFWPLGVRRTAKHHQIHSDSSYRFERGVDYDRGLARAAARAFGLIESLTGARCVGGHVAEGERPPTPEIALRPDRMRMILGMDVPDGEAASILGGLEVDVDRSDAARWICRPPTHRPDLALEEDLIEEVMRIHGLDELPAVATMPTAYGQSAATGLRSPGGALTRHQRDALVDALAAQGLHETVSFAFAELDKLVRVQGPDVFGLGVHLSNPMRGLGPMLRTHLLPGLLDAAALNVARHGRAVRLFEVGRVYGWGEPPTGEGPTAEIDRQLPEEPLRAAVLLVSARGADDPAPVDGRAVAGVLLDALRHVGLHATLRTAGVKDVDLAHLHPGMRGRIAVGENEVGSFGVVHPALVRAWDLPEGIAVVYGELAVDALPAPKPVAVVALPRFPSTSRDLSLDLAVEIAAADVVEALYQAERTLEPGDAIGAELAEPEPDATAPHADPPLLSVGDHGDAAIEVIEDYRGEGIAEGRRALLLRLGYRARERSVTDEEVQVRHTAIVDGALQQLRQRDPQAKRR